MGRFFMVTFLLIFSIPLISKINYHMKLIKIILCVILFFIIFQKSNAQINLSLFATGFPGAVDIKHAGDNRIFIVQQSGFIRIVDTSGTINPVPFLNIQSQVSIGSEQGLLGLAFSPNYATDGRFYVNYTDLSGNSHIARFIVSANPDVADLSSQENILDVAQPFANHNGGDLRFGVDGYLYCAFGDGGAGGDPGNRAQDLQQYLGKILRINVDVPSGYSIPGDNPFFGSPTALDEIWAYGVRNPWRNSFDRITNDYWIGDVGQNLHEEIHFQPASSTGGENYGWRCYEGNSAYNTAGCGAITNYVFPVYDYPHSGANSGCSVTGGNVYRGAIFSAMFGKYFFSDFCSNDIYSLTKNDTVFTFALENNSVNGDGFGTFGEDKYGELYIAGNSTGNIYKITSAFCNPTAFISVDDTINFCGDTLVISSPLGAGFFYAWFRDGIGVQASGNNTLAVTQSGNYYVQVLAGNGCSSVSDSVYVNLQSAPSVSFTGLPVFICLNQSAVSLTGIPPGGTFSGNGITGSTFDPVAAGQGSHKITYSYVAASGCTASASQIIAVDACVSVEENSFITQLNISPNPGNGEINLEITALKNNNSAEVEVFNVFGQVCYLTALNIQAGNNSFSFDLDNLKKGVYFLKLKSGDVVHVRKFIIMN